MFSFRMYWIDVLRALPAMTAIALLIAASFASVHASTFGDDQHTHNGVECAFAQGALNDDDVAAPPAVFVAVAEGFVVARALAPQRPVSPAASASANAPRAPPAR